MQRSYLGKTLVATELPVHTFPYRVRSVLRCGGRHSRFAEKMAAYRAWRDIIRRRIVAYYFGLTWYAWSSDRRTRQLDRKILRRRQRNYQSDTSRINRHFLQDKGGQMPVFFCHSF